MRRPPTFLVVLLLLLNGCGFQLRGLEDRHPFAIAVDRASPPEAVTALRRAGLPLADQAPQVLHIQSWQWQREAVSVDRAGRPLGYRLHLILQYRLQDPAGRPLGAPRRLDLFRDYLSPPEAALSREAQEAPLREALWREAAERIRRELRAPTS